MFTSAIFASFLYPANDVPNELANVPVLLSYALFQADVTLSIFEMSLLFDIKVFALSIAV